MTRRNLLVVLIIVGVSLLLLGGGPAMSGPDPIKVVLTWEGSADLDLEIWNGEASEPIGKAHNLGGSPDDKGPNGTESITLNTKELPAGVYVVAASFVNGEEASVPATITVDGKKLTAELNPTDQSLWFAFRVDSSTGAVKSIDRFW